MDEHATATMMRTDRLWRKQYRENRYLIGLTEHEIGQRFADIMTNSTTLTDDERSA
jgi:hypothetical protein